MKKQYEYEGQTYEADEMLKDCLDYAKSEGKISRSLLQRNFRLGYFRAGRIMAQIEAEGILDKEHEGNSDKERKVCF